MATVIDTNVWVAAAGVAEQADATCVLKCQQLLESLRSSETLAVDSRHAILDEYFRQIPRGTEPDLVLRELLRRSDRIEYRSCPCDARGRWQLPGALACLDPSDRKFVAVALTYDPPAGLCNALDSDWREASGALTACGVPVRELCPDCLRTADG